MSDESYDKLKKATDCVIKSKLNAFINDQQWSMKIFETRVNITLTIFASV